MRRFKLLAATVLGAGLMAAPLAGTAQTAAKPAAKAAPAKPAAKPAATATAPASTPAVDPASVQALATMGAYLRSLNAFELTADLVTDNVTDDGRKLQIGGTNTYKARRPNGFTIEMVSDRKVRKLYYDGKKLTLSAPRVGFYAQVDAPPTIRQTLDVLYDKYAVEVPLEDLFRWGEPGDNSDDLTKGFYVGPARIGGVETDQYAYSSGDVDWQVWIARGDKPLPQKIVITSRAEPTQPQFAATMKWNTAPTLTDADFTFIPPANAKAITFASVEPAN